jgi:hypothetical protein
VGTTGYALGTCSIQTFSTYDGQTRDAEDPTTITCDLCAVQTVVAGQDLSDNGVTFTIAD